MTRAADTNGLGPLVPGLCHAGSAGAAISRPALLPAAGRAANLGTRRRYAIRNEASKEASREATALQQSVELDRFLAGVERRAFRIALFGVRNPDDALDVVQDAMLQLARKYADKPAEEWTPLFYRILNNRIRDFQRHGTVRARVLALLPGTRATAGQAASEAPGGDVSQDAADPAGVGPQRQSMLDGSMAALEDAVGALPPRQREAFLLRTLEGLSVRDTAAAMGCSEGSVKTHCFRAVAALRLALGDHWLTED